MACISKQVSDLEKALVDVEKTIAEKNQTLTKLTMSLECKGNECAELKAANDRLEQKHVRSCVFTRFSGDTFI